MAILNPLSISIFDKKKQKTLTNILTNNINFNKKKRGAQHAAQGTHSAREDLVGVRPTGSIIVESGLRPEFQKNLFFGIQILPDTPLCTLSTSDSSLCRPSLSNQRFRRRASNELVCPPSLPLRECLMIL